MIWWHRRARRKKKGVEPSMDDIRNLARQAEAAKEAATQALRAAKSREPEVSSIHRFAVSAVTANHFSELITDSMHRRMRNDPGRSF